MIISIVKYDKQKLYVIQISLKVVPKVSVDNKAVLVQIMAWRRIGDMSLSEPMMS